MQSLAARNEQDCSNVEHEHQPDKLHGLLRRAAELVVVEEAPQRGHHRRGLADGVRERHPDLLSRQQVTERAHCADRASREAVPVLAPRQLLPVGERRALADERPGHEQNKQPQPAPLTQTLAVELRALAPSPSPRAPSPQPDPNPALPLTSP